jgi:hypothetical protein
MTIEVRCPLISDLGPNDGARTGAATAYGCLDQDPSDGDTTRIRYSAAMQQNVCGVDWSPVPVDAAIQYIKVKWSEAGTASASDAAAGLRYTPTGNNHYGPSRSLPSHNYSASFSETFLTNPENGQGWTYQQMIDNAVAHVQDSMDLEPQYPRLTQLVVYVGYLPAPVHDDATVSNPAGYQGAGTSIQGCTAIAQSLAPTAVPSSIASRATAARLNPEDGGAS